MARQEQIDGDDDRHHEADPSRANERRLQRWIAESHSELLPGITPGATAVAEEVRMPGAGRADVVVVHRNGEIWIVECKLARNPEIRRWVIGQVLSYAAALWKLDFKNLERAFAAADSSLTKSFRKEPDWDVEAFRRDVSKNLAAGAFRLIIAVDEIDAKQERKLERAVAFINSHSGKQLQVLALVLNPGDDGNPQRRVIGDDSEVIDPLTPDWKADRRSLVSKIGSPEDAQLAEELLDWAEDMDLDTHYTKKTGTAVVETRSGTLFRISSKGAIQVSLRALQEGGGSAEVKRMKHALAGIDDRFETEKDRPKAPLDALSDEGKQLFLALMERYVRTMSDADSA